MTRQKIKVMNELLGNYPKNKELGARSTNKSTHNPFDITRVRNRERGEEAVY